MSNDFILSRIAAKKAQIIIYDDAIAALGTAGVQSYKLDTGQSVQWVTKMDVADLNKVAESLYNQLVTLEARCTGNGVLQGRPGF